jgi:hypothetical protein
MISNGLRLLILQSACSATCRPIIVGGWIRVRYLLHTCTWPFRFTAKHSRHIKCTWTTFLNLGRDNNARRRIRSLRIEIDELTRMRSQNNLDKFARKLYKNTSPMKWKYFLHWRHAFTPNYFQMHWAVTWSYCKRENSLTKLNNSESVMSLVVRLASSPILFYFILLLKVIPFPWQWCLFTMFTCSVSAAYKIRDIDVGQDKLSDGESVVHQLKYYYIIFNLYYRCKCHTS